MFDEFARAAFLHTLGKADAPDAFARLDRMGAAYVYTLNADGMVEILSSHDPWGRAEYLGAIQARTMAANMLAGGALSVGLADAAALAAARDAGQATAVGSASPAAADPLDMTWDEIAQANASGRPPAVFGLPSRLQAVPPAFNPRDRIRT